MVHTQQVLWSQKRLQALHSIVCRLLGAHICIHKTQMNILICISITSKCVLWFSLIDTIFQYFSVFLLQSKKKIEYIETATIFSCLRSSCCLCAWNQKKFFELQKNLEVSPINTTAAHPSLLGTDISNAKSLFTRYRIFCNKVLLISSVDGQLSAL